MEAPAQPERLNQSGFEAFAGRAGEDGPVVMLNLLSFDPTAAGNAMRNMAPPLPRCWRRPARVVFSGNSTSALLGEESWDQVHLVEYPSRQAFLDMIGSDEYQAIGHLRTEALAKGELHPMDPTEIAI